MFRAKICAFDKFFFDSESNENSNVNKRVSQSQANSIIQSPNEKEDKQKSRNEAECIIEMPYQAKDKPSGKFAGIFICS